MRVVFLGNHTVGVRVLETICASDEIAAVVAHPPDPEDGVRYESVFNFAQGRGWNVMRGRGKDRATLDFVSTARPDLIWITDYRYLIPTEMIACARLGAVNLHPSLLPKYRGRASINWALLHGETRLGLTGHFVDEGLDSGDIIEQVSYEVSEEQDAGDCLNILYPLYADLTKRILAHFHSGNVPRVRQDQSQATSFPARKPEHGGIDWKQSARSILNLVRAVAAPYPGAFTTIDGARVTIWKARVAMEAGSSAEPGNIVEAAAERVLVQCGEGVLSLARVDWPSNHRPQVGERLGC